MLLLPDRSTCLEFVDDEPCGRERIPAMGGRHRNENGSIADGERANAMQRCHANEVPCLACFSDDVGNPFFDYTCVCFVLEFGDPRPTR